MVSIPGVRLQEEIPLFLLYPIARHFPLKAQNDCGERTFQRAEGS
jgi:hypothetical protein